MPTYKYRVMDSNGIKMEGTYTAKNMQEFTEMIKGNNYYPLMIKETVDREKEDIFYKFTRVNTKEIAVFCRQFSTMLNAGISILSCVDTLKEQVANKKLKNALKDVFEDVQKANLFSEALGRHKDVFPDLLVNMIRSGEISGNLDIIMERMAVHYEKENKINNKLRSAMIYPMVLACLSVCVVIFMLTFIMPTFIGMFQNSGVALPGPTRFMLALSNNLKKFWYVIIAAVIAIVYGINYYAKTQDGAMLLDTIKIRLPIINRTTKIIIISRFTRTLSTLVASSITLVDSLEVVSTIVGNKVAEAKIMQVREQAMKGNGLYEPMKNTGIFPPMLCSMVKIGEDSGSLDEILNKTADFYDEELETGLQRFAALMEPAMIIVMGIMIGFMVIAMLMPMFDMFKTVQ